MFVDSVIKNSAPTVIHPQAAATKKKNKYKHIPRIHLPLTEMRNGYCCLLALNLWSDLAAVAFPQVINNMKTEE
jgi:hypothetical protein